MGSCYSKRGNNLRNLPFPGYRTDQYFSCNDTLRYFEANSTSNHDNGNTIFENGHNLNSQDGGVDPSGNKWNSRSTFNDEEYCDIHSNSYISILNGKEVKTCISDDTCTEKNVFERYFEVNMNVKEMTWQRSIDRGGGMNEKSSQIMKIIRFNSRTVKYYAARHKDLRSHGTVSSSKSSNNHRWPHHASEFLFLPMYPVDFRKADDYEVCKWIGCGTFSQVYQVKDKFSEECFALKKLQKSNVITQKICTQILEEIDILMRIGSHPFILGIVSCWQTKGYLLQLLPYAPNGDLHTLWKKEKQFPLSCVAHVSAEVAKALDHIHGSNIIYRDLKMENILISPSGHTLLSDFGLAKYMGKFTRTYSICGTLNYLAPEVASGCGHSYECDWWSLGVLIVTMSTGQLPFKPAEDHVAMRQVIKKSMAELPMITSDQAIQEVIFKLLQYEPGRRISTLHELQQLELYSYIDILEVLNTENGPLKSYFNTV